jgi:hypothetical protein
MSAERGKDAAERFAAAVDKGRSPLSAGSDADLARELEIVAMLRSREGTYASHAEAMAMLRSDGAAAFGGPRPDEKARAKQRLMAALAADGPGAAETDEQDAAVVTFPQVAAGYRTAQFPAVDAHEETDLVADDADKADPGNVTPLAGRVSRRAGRHSMPATGRSRAVPDRRAGLARRAGLVGSAALFVMIAFTGAGVFASRDALPGQTLYPLKRAAEAAGLAMTFDDEARAQRNLELAATRLSEVEKLIALRGASDVDPQLVRAAMSEFDVATSEGSRALLSGQNGDSGTLKAWAATQSARLSALRPALPVPAVPAADSSIALLDLLLGRSGDASSPSLDRTGAGTTDEARGENTTDKPGLGESRIGTSGGSTGGGGTPNSTEDGALEPLQPDNGPLSADPDVEKPATQNPADTSDHDSANLPLPLPGAPITLPPLLPGMPPLTIG